jgi:spore coat protein CotH
MPLRSRPSCPALLGSLATALLAAALLFGCSSSGSEGASSSDDSAPPAEPEPVLFDSNVLTELAVDVDQAEYDAMIATYVESGDKDWIHADVTVDGVTYEDAGMRLKGNSSLFGLGGAGPQLPGGGEIPSGLGIPGAEATSEEPQSLPWLIQLDRFVDGQAHGGTTDLVVRSNSSETALNEAMSLDLLELAGLPTQDWTHAGFSVNGSDPVLRLVIENPNDEWDAANFDSEGILYKAKSGGDYSYRGDDPDAYAEVFDQETRKDEENLTPLIELLDFINNADDATFAEELAEHVEVGAFAQYLAMEELLANFDDIEGPGNNSYLRWDEETDRITIVAWDHNLALGGFGAGGFGGGEQGGGAPAAPPDGLFGANNVLAERFKADPELGASYEAALDELRQSLYRSGQAEEMLEHRVQILTENADGLVEAATIRAEADSIVEIFRQG